MVNLGGKIIIPCWGKTRWKWYI